MPILFSFRYCLSLGVVPWWLPPCSCVYIFTVCVCARVYYCGVVLCVLSHLWALCMHVKVSFSPGPLVFPGPIFMNQREQALARIRPLQALRHKRDKHKGTTVFTNSAGAETPLLTDLAVPSTSSLTLWRQNSWVFMVSNNVACWIRHSMNHSGKMTAKLLDQVEVQFPQQTPSFACYVYIENNTICRIMKISSAMLIHFPV